MSETISLGRMVRGFVGLAIIVLVAGQTGCIGSADPIVNLILDSQIREQLGLPPVDTARIQLINTTESDIELDVLLDGTLVTITCTAEEGSCAYTPSDCPLTITTVEERRYTVQGGVFRGGRLYNENAAFTFTSTEFDCQSVITYTFTEDNTTAQVL